jgi:hypothetical protein
MESPQVIRFDILTILIFIFYVYLTDIFQKLSDHPLAIDAVWFGGGNKDGVYLVISGARRKQR